MIERKPAANKDIAKAGGNWLIKIISISATSSSSLEVLVVMLTSRV